MQLPSKPAWLLIGVHTLCLCVGGWFMYQLVASTTEQQAAEEAWERLATRATPLARLAQTIESADLVSDTEEQAELASLSTSISKVFNHTGVLLVSRSGQVERPVSPTAVDHWKTGDSITWRAEDNSFRTPGGRRGWLKTPTGLRVAISYLIADGSASIMVYDNQGTLPAWRQSLLASLPLAAGIAFLWTWILTSVSTFLFSARLHFEESTRKAQIEHDAFRSAQDLVRTRDAVIFGLAKLAESRDPETGHHLERISLYSTRLANALRSSAKHHRTITPGFVRLLGISSVLHDIGKVGLEDTVLLKPGKLNEEERKKMQEHTLVAGACLKEIEQRLGASNFLETAREIALYHHERWDGNGYPAGLAGDAIPLAARIVTVVDVYDALASKRVYKEAFPHDECVRLIREGAGTQFDPELVEVFLSIEADFAAISRKFASSQPTQDPVSKPEADDTPVMTDEQESILRDVVTGTNSSETTPQRSSFVA